MVLIEGREPACRKTIVSEKPFLELSDSEREDFLTKAYDSVLELIKYVYKRCEEELNDLGV